MNIFEMLYPRFYFDKSKPIRLFEAFAGIGCQAMALKRITDNIELVGISEIDKPAIQSYMAIHGQVKNYGDITKMETIPECDIFTWSFPCTDLSKAGKQKGLTDTRSGLVYEVLRLLKATDKKPKVLIMENVIDLVQVKFVEPFNEIQAELEQLGYTNYNEVLNAKHYGIPQNRERVFMVSILKDEFSDHYSYDFPIRKELKLRLKDLLEDEVDEKYYLSKKALEGLQQTTFNSSKLESRTEDENGVMPTLCARDYKDPKLVQVAQLDGYESSGRIYDENGLAPTINTMGGGQREPKIVIKTWNDCFGVVVAAEIRTDEGIRTFDDNNMGALRTTGSCGDKVVIELSSKNKRLKSVVDNNDFSKDDTKNIDIFNQKISDISQTITLPNHNSQALFHNLRIRKLTPLECWRLMGISDEDFNKAKASGMSNSQLYKQAGNGIVVNVFEAILREMII